MLELKNISKKYQERIIIDDLSMTFPDIGMIGIQGKSGCGKSTLLSIIGMLDFGYEGDILFNGEKIKNSKQFIKEHISFMMQNKDMISSLTVKENICLSSQIGEKKIHQNQLMKIVKQLGIDDYLDRYPSQLSGGQCKRVSIAKALLKESSILLCDEPTGALHEKQSEEVMSILKKVSQKCLVIIVSHEPCLLEKYCDSVLSFQDGKLIGEIKQISFGIQRNIERKKYSLLIYPFRQILFQRNKLMFLFLFQWILIVAFFVMATAMNGIWDMIQRSEVSSVLSNVMTLEQKEGMAFERLPNLDVIHISYQYHLEQCQLYQDDKKTEGVFNFLPENKDHIILIEGRMPQNSYEVLVSHSYAQSVHLNHPIVLRTFDHDIPLHIVGVVQPMLFEEKEIYLSSSLQEQLSFLKDDYEIVIETDKEKTFKTYKELSKDYIVYSEVIERKESYQALLELAKIVGFVFVGVSFIVSLILIGIVQSILYYERKHDVAYLLSLGLSYRHLFILSLIESFLLGVMIVVGGCVLSSFIYFYMNSIYQIHKHFYFSLKLAPIIWGQYDLYILIAILYIGMTIIGGIKPIYQMMSVDIIDVLREE